MVSAKWKQVAQIIKPYAPEWAKHVEQGAKYVRELRIDIPDPQNKIPADYNKVNAINSFQYCITGEARGLYHKEPLESGRAIEIYSGCSACVFLSIEFEKAFESGKVQFVTGVANALAKHMEAVHAKN